LGSAINKAVYAKKKGQNANTSTFLFARDMCYHRISDTKDGNKRDSVDPLENRHLNLTRRQLFGRLRAGVGTAALASLFGETSHAAENSRLPGIPHFAPKAKRVIYLTQSGAPSQVDLFDYKPLLEKYKGQELPDSVRQGQRLTTMTAGQKLHIQPSKFAFKQHGKSGAWVSELMPHTAEIVDDLCFIKTMHTESINHAPGMCLFLTGGEQPGRPSAGAWLSYGLGTMNRDLPAFVVLLSRDRHGTCGQLLFEYYWGSGFLPSKYQGVKFRAAGDPVLYLTNPPGVSSAARRALLDDLGTLNQRHFQETGDPEIQTRIAQYEMAYRMQTSVPDLTDISKEPASVREMYGPEVEKPGSFARNCLLARRLAERDVRFIQLFHVGWDTHRNLIQEITMQCEDTDRPSAALVKDLKQRGLLDDTLVVWAGEFGRTVYSQGTLDDPTSGRDHHGRCFTIWMAGGGVKAGYAHGETDDYSYNIVKDPVHVHDLQATMLHLMGIDHTRLTYRFQGRDFRLTDVAGNVVRGVLA
jgi:hypothetical protein